MVNQREALDKLNKEKEYEDRLADDLLNYYLMSLEKISDLNEEERKKVEKTLKIIARESQMHSNLFSVLIHYVLNNGETNY